MQLKLRWVLGLGLRIVERSTALTAKGLSGIFVDRVIGRRKLKLKSVRRVMSIELVVHAVNRLIMRLGLVVLVITLLATLRKSAESLGTCCFGPTNVLNALLVCIIFLLMCMVLTVISWLLVLMRRLAAL